MLLAFRFKQGSDLRDEQAIFKYVLYDVNNYI